MEEIISFTTSQFMDLCFFFKQEQKLCHFCIDREGGKSLHNKNLQGDPQKRGESYIYSPEGTICLYPGLRFLLDLGNDCG